MGIITDLIEKRGSQMKTDYDSGQWPSLTKYMTKESMSGVALSEQLAMNYIIVYACVRLLSETIASLPLLTYKRIKGGGKERAPDYPAYTLLHDKPNPVMTSFNYRQKQMVDLLLWGNSYSQIVKNNAQNVTELWPLEPDKMLIRGTVQDHVYIYKPDTDAETIFQSNEILHIPGLSFDGFIGYPPLTIMREAVGLGIALENFGATFFRNGTNIGGIAQHPKALGEKARKFLEESLMKKTGVGNSNSLLILEEGMTYQKIGIPPEDAQFLETRRFQVTEIARFFNVPPHMVGDLERSTNNNIEEQAIEFVVYTLRPWLVRIEQEYCKDIIPDKDKPKYYVEHLVDGLLRGNIESRSRALQIQRQNGIINADEWREIENKNAIPDGSGKIYLANSAMQPVDKLGENQESGGEPNNGTGNGTANITDSGNGNTED